MTFTRLLICTTMIVASAGSVTAQNSSTAPSLNTLVQGASVVSGSAAAGAAPVDVYDISYPVKTKIGTATATADDGKFYCAVKAPLVLGHQIIAIDKNGNTSAPVTVTATNPNPGPAPS
jgi:hypothetical protein